MQDTIHHKPHTTGPVPASENTMSNMPDQGDGIQENHSIMESEKPRSRWKIFLTMIALSVSLLHNTMPMKALKRIEMEHLRGQEGKKEINKTGF